MEYYMLVRRVTKDILSYPHRPRADTVVCMRVAFWHPAWTFRCRLSPLTKCKLPSTGWMPMDAASASGAALT